MKLFAHMKDGGKESRVEGFWLIEAKKLLSIALLHFSDGSREAYHSHAFNSISWVLRGKLTQERLYSTHDEMWSDTTEFLPSFRPVITTRDNVHMVRSTGDTWVITFRGPWTSTWQEFLPLTQRFVTLTHGRKVVAESPEVA